MNYANLSHFFLSSSHEIDTGTNTDKELTGILPYACIILSNLRPKNPLFFHAQSTPFYCSRWNAIQNLNLCFEKQNKSNIWPEFVVIFFFNTIVVTFLLVW